MPPEKIKAILFDLGETLLIFGKVNSNRLFSEAARHSYNYLKKLGQPVGKLRLYTAYNLLGVRLNVLLSAITGNDFDSLTLLKKYGQKKSYNLTEEQWQQLNWHWYEPLYKLSSIEPDLANTLGQLTSAGLKLGIVSNTFVSSCSLDKHLTQEGLIDFFPIRVYSCQFSSRKPSKRIFLEAASRIDTPPENIMFVGDRVNKDIKGARKAGMHPVLKTAHTNKGRKIPKGTYKIDAIAELPALVKKVNNSETGGHILRKQHILT